MHIAFTETVVMKLDPALISVPVPALIIGGR